MWVVRTLLQVGSPEGSELHVGLRKGWVPKLVTVDSTSSVPPGFTLVVDRVWVTPRS